MSDSKQRASLLNLRRPDTDEKKPLLVPASAPTTPALEEALLGREGTHREPEPKPQPEPRQEKEPTTPVTFHLPIRLRDRIRMTARVKNMTQLEVAKAALEAYLDSHPVSEAEIRALLSL